MMKKMEKIYFFTMKINTKLSVLIVVIKVDDWHKLNPHANHIVHLDQYVYTGYDLEVI
jgi:hypothetical protein